MSCETIRVGIDEVGRGSMVGPVVACSVYFTEPQTDEEKENRDYLLSNMKDSKKLSKKKLAQIYDVLTRSAFVHYKLASRSAKIIDHVNILQATLQCFHDLAIHQDGYYHIIDGNIYPLSVPGEALIKADDSIHECMAASIIAKVVRDRLLQKMAKRYPSYQWDKNAGYGTASHMENIDRFGYNKHHRMSFFRKREQRKNG